MTATACASFIDTDQSFGESLSQTRGLKDRNYAPAHPLTAMGSAPARHPTAKLQALLPHFEMQQTDCSCSLASVSMVLNAALAQRGRPVKTQAQVLASDTTGVWAKATGDDPNCTGVDLDGLALFAMRSFFAAGQKNVGVDVHHVEVDNDQSRDSLRHALALNDAEVDDLFVVLNFHQKTIMGAGDDVGHMSVAAAYDERRDQVLILDVDNRGLKPYWIGLQRLVQSMDRDHNDTGAPRGYLVIRLNR